MQIVQWLSRKRVCELKDRNSAEGQDRKIRKGDEADALHGTLRRSEELLCPSQPEAYYNSPTLSKVPCTRLSDTESGIISVSRWRVSPVKPGPFGNGPGRT